MVIEEHLHGHTAIADHRHRIGDGLESAEDVGSGGVEVFGFELADGFHQFGTPQGRKRVQEVNG